MYIIDIVGVKIVGIILYNAIVGAIIIRLIVYNHYYKCDYHKYITSRGSVW